MRDINSHPWKELQKDWLVRLACMQWQPSVLRLQKKPKSLSPLFASEIVGPIFFGAGGFGEQFGAEIVPGEANTQPESVKTNGHSCKLSDQPRAPAYYVRGPFRTQKAYSDHPSAKATRLAQEPPASQRAQRDIK